MDLATIAPRALTKTVLVVIQEPSIRDLIAANLRHAGLYPVAAASAQVGRALIDQVVPDAIVVDLDAEPLEVSAFVSGLQRTMVHRKVPVLMLTAQPASSCGATRLRCGADDCVAKPFSPQELVQRTVGLFARPPASSRKALIVGPLELRPDDHTLLVDTATGVRDLVLPPGEFKLLRHLMEHPDRVLRRQQVKSALWGEGADIDMRTVDQLVKRLRRALGRHALGGMVQTVRGIGYRLASRDWETTP